MTKKTNKEYNIYKQFFLFLLLYVIVFCGLTGCGKRIEVPAYDDSVEPADEVSMFAIVTNLDEVNGKLTLKSVNYETEITLNYTGGADIQDKYGNLLPISQVELGSVVDVIYDDNRDKLMSLYLSGNDKVQKLESVSGVVVDNLEETVLINGVTYRMSANTSAFSDNTEIAVNEICTEDQISVWLYNDVVCSMYVELGHGYVKLSDYDSYMGGMVEIGYDVIVPVTEDMLLTVREGEYTLRISKDDDVGTKNVQVVKNQEINVSLADIAVEPKQKGSVMFQITPSDAAVYIDGKRVNTEGAIELVYGKHKIYITADGYDTYSATFNVDYAYKIKSYSLTASDATTTESSTTATTTSTTSSKTTTETTTQSTTTSGTTQDSQATTSNKATVSTPVGASVYLDGEYLGIAPISFTKVTGSHIITLSMTSYLSKSYTVTFTDDGKDVTLKYDDLISISSLVE